MNLKSTENFLCGLYTLHNKYLCIIWNKEVIFEGFSMKKIHIGLFTMIIFAVTSCFNPWDGEEGIITINFYDYARASFVDKSEIGNFNHEVTLWNSRNELIDTKTFTGSRGTFNIKPGTYKLTVKALGAKENNVSRDDLRAYGIKTGVEVKPGQNKSETVEMISAAGVSDWDELLNAIDNIMSLYDLNEGRDFYILIQESFAAEMLSIEEGGEFYYREAAIEHGKITLIAEKNITIHRAEDHFWSSFFSVTGGELTLGLEGMPGTITIDGMNIERTTSPLIKVSGGKLTMNNGVTLKNNISPQEGGGAVSVTINEEYNWETGDWIVKSIGTFNMYGGTISGNKANEGGGVAVIWGGTFNMYGGTISQNKAHYTGGGVYVYYGNFSKTGGTIYGDDNGLGNLVESCNESWCERCFYSDNLFGHAVYAEVGYFDEINYENVYIERIKNKTAGEKDNLFFIINKDKLNFNGEWDPIDPDIEPEPDIIEIESANDLFSIGKSEHFPIDGHYKLMNDIVIPEY